MTALSDAQLADAGLLSDAILGFRAAMKGRVPKDPAHVEMPEHFQDERYLPRRLEFRRGVRIATTWRLMRTGAGVARREDRNEQFRTAGIAYCIDPDEVREEAVRLLRSSVAQADHFYRPDPELVHEIVRSLDHVPRDWDQASAVLFYDAGAENGVLSTTNPTTLRAMGERGWSSAEAVYQAQKFPDDISIQDAVHAAPDALAAKAVAREHRAKRRRDWTAHRPTAMARVAVLRVEQDPAYRSFLLATGDRAIVEDTTGGEHDPVWGVVAGRGANLAGQIAAAVRTRLVDGDRRLLVDGA